MKLVGMMLLLFGGVIVLTAIVLLRLPLERACFIAAGIAIELLGFALLARDYAQSPHAERPVG